MENEWEERKRPTERVMLELYLKKTGIYKSENIGHCISYDVMSWLQTKFLPMVKGQWLVSEILHFTPIIRQTLVSLGPVWLEL